MRAHRTNLLPWLALLAITCAAAAEDDMRGRLATQFVRSSVLLYRYEPLTQERLDGAISLIRFATELSPDDSQIWRIALNLADFADDAELKSRALVQLAQLDKHDERVRLRRVVDHIDNQTHTYEERVELYQRLLTEERQAILGPAVASRLAMDLALLYHRRGDIESFAQWLARAVTVDSSNASAAAMAAGFFRLNVDDPYGEAELLVNLLLADPTDLVTQAALAELLLREGAYRAADRIYALIDATRSSLNQPLLANQMSDWAIARWGDNNPDGALRLIDRVQKYSNAMFQRAVRRQQPDLAPWDPLVDKQGNVLPPLRTTAPPAAAMVRAAIYNLVGGDAADAGFLAVMQTYTRRQAELIQTPDVEPADLSRTLLESAFAAAWLGRRSDELRKVVEAAELNQPLSDEAKARFEGWIALNNGHFEQAMQHFEPQIETEITARLGYALTLESRGELKQCANHLLHIVREQPGTLIGVWCRKRLEQIVGQPVPATEEVKRLSRLIASIPRIVDRMPRDPTFAFTMEIIPHKIAHAPYEPILVDVKVTNKSPIPLSIGPAGPIVDRVALMPFVQNSKQNFARVPLMFIDVNQRLRLDPMESLVFSIDLRRTNISEYINTAPIGGATIRIRAVSNFAVTNPQSVVPGLYGSRFDAPEIRVDGVRVRIGDKRVMANAQAGDEPDLEPRIRSIDEPDLKWLVDTTERLAAIETEDVSDMADMALVAHLVSGRMPQGVPKEVLDVFDRARVVALEEKFDTLSPESQAWLLTVVPMSAALAHIDGMAAARSKNKYVLAALLLHRLSGPDDKLFGEAARSDDDDVHNIAEAMHSWLMDRDTNEGR